VIAADLRGRFAVTSLVISLALGVLAATADPAGGSRPVTIKGTAYRFNDPEGIPGAKIRAAGAPGAEATSRPDGSYALEVPDDTKVTPYIEAEGYHRIYLQTFYTDGRDVRKVNFQTPSEDVYMALADLLDVRLDESGDPARCAIVSTASTFKVRDLSFAEFVAFGAHGVPGATSSTKPSLGDPIYFNKDVIPDPSLTETSRDGGIIWTEVPRANYKVRAEHPRKGFATFRATCRDGRIVNANPPWGLYELRPGEKQRPEV
jgi:hypothetical protein